MVFSGWELDWKDKLKLQSMNQDKWISEFLE